MKLTVQEDPHEEQYLGNVDSLTAGGVGVVEDVMGANKHQLLAYRTSKKEYAPLTFQQFELIHAVLGLASELGEIADTVKKHVIYGRPLDTENLAEEVGDSDWYAALLLTAINEFRSIAMERNIEKLRKRYPDGYSDLAAVARADKAKSNLMPVCSKCDLPLERKLYTDRTLVCATMTCERYGEEGVG